MASLPPPPLQTTSPYQSIPPPSCSSSLHCPLCNIVFDSPKSLDVHLAYQHDQLANQWALDVNGAQPPGVQPLHKMEYSNGAQDTRLYSSAYESGPDPFNHSVPPMSQAYYGEPRYDAFVGVNPPRRYHPYAGPGTPFHPTEALNGGGGGPGGNHPQCDKCGGVFDSMPALMDHMHTHHASTPTSHSATVGYPATESYWAQPGLVGLSGNSADTLTTTNTPTSTPTPKAEGGNEAAEILDLDSHKVHVYQPPGSGLAPQSLSLHHPNRPLAPTPPYTPATSGSSVGWMTPPPLVHSQQPPTPQNYRRPEDSGYNPNNLHAFSGYAMSPGPGPTGPVVPATHGTPPYPSPSPTLAPNSRNSPAPNTASWKASSGGQGGSEAKRPKTYNCEACNKWFTSSGHLKRHYNTTLHKNAVKAGAPDPALRTTGRGKKAASQVQPPPPPEDGSGPSSPVNSQDDSQSSSSASNSRGMEDPSKSSQPSPRPLQHTINMSDLSSSVSSSISSSLSGPGQHPQPLPGMPPMHSPHMTPHPPVSSPLAFAGHIPPPPVHSYGPPLPPMGAGPLGNAPFPIPVQGSGPGPGPGPGLVSRLMHAGPGGAVVSTGSPYPMAPLQHHVGQHPYYQTAPPPPSSAMGHMGMMHPPRTGAGATLPPSPSHHPGLAMSMPPYHQQQHSYHNNGGYSHPPNPMAPLLSSGPSNLGSTEHEIYSGAGQSASQTHSILPHHLHNNNNNNNNDDEESEMVTAEKIKKELQLEPMQHPESGDLHGSAEEDMLLEEREGDDGSNIGGDVMDEPPPPLPPATEPEHEHENEAPVKRGEDGTFKCTECDKAFNRVCYLTQHNNSFHAGEKPFKCKTCGKRFPDADLFREHQSKHAGEKPYKCELCPKQFNHKTDLRRHMCLHTGEKPFRCEVCRKGFIRKDHMMKHVQTHNRANKAHAT